MVTKTIKTRPIQLIDISKVSKAEYNPRKRDKKRFDLLKLSLQIFGWLMPAFIDENNVLLSGHQRTEAWEELGYNQIPVIKLTGLSLDQKKSFNLLFNLATNDLERNIKIKNLPQINTEVSQENSNLYSCLETKIISIDKVKWNKDLFDDGFQYSNSLIKKNVFIPIVIDKDYNIINGSKRLVSLLRNGYKEAECIIYKGQNSKTVKKFLNCISMDFKIEDKYSDILKYSSFRRPRLIRKSLGMGYLAWIGFKRGVDFNFQNESHQSKFIKFFGRNQIEIGGGHLTEHNKIKTFINHNSFEPYHCVNNNPSLEASRKITNVFLENLEKKKKWSSVIIPSVFNSVPFERDRENIVIIAGVFDCPVYINLLTITKQQFVIVTGKKTNKDALNSIYMPANYEKNVIIGSIDEGKPKAQKAYELQEAKTFFTKFYKNVKIYSKHNQFFVKLKGPIKVSEQRFIEAVEEEFNLPYPNNQSLQMQNKAIQVLKKYYDILT